MAGSVDILAQLPQLESLCERLYNSQASTQSPPFIVPQITSTLPYSLLWICSVSYSPVFEYPDNHQVCRMLPKEPTLSKCCASSGSRQTTSQPARSGPVFVCLAPHMMLSHAAY